MPSLKKPEEPLIVTTKDAYPALRKYLVYTLIVALSLSSLIPWTPFRSAVLSVLGVTLLFLLFDIYNQLHARLSAIEVNVGSPHPPTWENFMEAQASILAQATTILEAGRDLHVEVIGVSARFSWRMIEDHFGTLLKKFDRNKFKIDVVIVTRETLLAWHLPRWIEDLDRTISGMEFFANENSTDVSAGRLTLARYHYDNLPQWHGVLLNKEVLFMGRTEWITRADNFPDLKVGQCRYRKFETIDRYGGLPRITMFVNWINRFRDRHDELQRQTEPKQSA